MHATAHRPIPAIDPETRRQTRRRQRLQMVGMVYASYVVDSSLQLALVLAGGLALQVPLICIGAGTALSGAFYALLGSGWTERFEDHYLVGPQMMAHALVPLGLAWYAPEIGVPMLMVLFITFGFGALRVNPNRLRSGAILGTAVVVAGVFTVVVLVGDRLAMPTATWQQRTLCGLWMVAILARSTLLGLYSAKLRILVKTRNEELAATFDKLEQMATSDELTGTLNRRSVMRLLDEERQRMERTGQPFGVVLFDLDHFKQVNDGHGHLVGDETLRHFTRVVSASMRTTDRLGRYGGEEFLMLLTATADEAAASIAAERAREGTVRHDWAAVAPGLKVTVSAGVALCRRGETAEQLLDRADQALYEAKRSGRNRVAVAGPAPNLDPATS
jgi:diguanylate cyclase (GGDEF)-like protein